MNPDVVEKFHRVIMDNDESTVLQMLQEGIDVNADLNFKSPLGKELTSVVDIH